MMLQYPCSMVSAMWHLKLLSQAPEHTSAPHHDEKNCDAAGLILLELDASDHESGPGDDSYAVGKGILADGGLEYEPDTDSREGNRNLKAMISTLASNNAT